MTNQNEQLETAYLDFKKGVIEILGTEDLPFPKFSEFPENTLKFEWPLKKQKLDWAISTFSEYIDKNNSKMAVEDFDLKYAISIYGAYLAVETFNEFDSVIKTFKKSDTNNTALNIIPNERATQAMEYIKGLHEIYVGPNGDAKKFLSKLFKVETLQELGSLYNAKLLEFALEPL